MVRLSLCIARRRWHSALLLLRRKHVVNAVAFKLCGACHIRVPSMYATHACHLCMPFMHVTYVCHLWSDAFQGSKEFIFSRTLLAMTGRGRSSPRWWAERSRITCGWFIPPSPALLPSEKTPAARCAQLSFSTRSGDLFSVLVRLL